MCKIIIKLIVTFPITEKRLLKFGFKKTRIGFRNGQGVFVKDRHMNDCGSYSDTFYFDLASKEIVCNPSGNAGMPISEHVTNMYELKQFYNQYKNDISYPNETLYENKNLKTDLDDKEINFIENGYRLQAIKSLSLRLNKTIKEAKEMVVNYMKENNIK
jgi:hypothetical protein